MEHNTAKKIFIFFLSVSFTSCYFSRLSPYCTVAWHIQDAFGGSLLVAKSFSSLHAVFGIFFRLRLVFFCLFSTGQKSSSLFCLLTYSRWKFVCCVRLIIFDTTAKEDMKNVANINTNSQKYNWWNNVNKLGAFSPLNIATVCQMRSLCFYFHLPFVHLVQLTSV